MRDPFLWSIPLGRWFGIQVKVHLLFPVVAAGLVLRAAYRTDPPPIPGAWIDATIVTGLAALSILFHEFAHCFVARGVGGEASEVLLWPLGGLASVDLPQRPRAHFLTAAAGPASNLLLGAVALSGLQFVGREALMPSWNPFSYMLREADGLVSLYTWSGIKVLVSPYSAAALLAWVVRVNYLLCLLNVVLVGFPMDAGRILQSGLWPIFGYRQSMMYAVVVGFVVMFGVAIYSIFAESVLALGLALFIYVSCRTQWFILETGGEESLFGYDFSQGYTSLERDLPPAAPPRPRRASWWQQFKKNRAAERHKRAEAERIHEERRMDELLEKVQREGITALTDEERRFMKRVSDRYRNRH
jgi:stage IV sporulation protein FB